MGLSGVELPASADVPYFYDGTYGDLYYDVIDAVEIRITGCEKEVTVCCAKNNVVRTVTREKHCKTTHSVCKKNIYEYDRGAEFISSPE